MIAVGYDPVQIKDSLQTSLRFPFMLQQIETESSLLVFRIMVLQKDTTPQTPEAVPNPISLKEPTK